jgi:hypothetical protein
VAGIPINNYYYTFYKHMIICCVTKVPNCCKPIVNKSEELDWRNYVIKKLFKMNETIAQRITYLPFADATRQVQFSITTISHSLSVSLHLIHLKSHTMYNTDDRLMDTIQYSDSKIFYIF